MTPARAGTTPTEVAAFPAKADDPRSRGDDHEGPADEAEFFG